MVLLRNVWAGSDGGVKSGNSCLVLGGYGE